MLRRLLLLSLILIIAIAAAAFSRAPLVRRAVHRGLDKLSTRLGQDVAAARIEPEGIGGVRLSEVRIGTDDPPLVTVRELDAWAPPEDLLHGRRTPARIELRDFVVRVRGDGTPEGLVEAVKKLRPPPAPEEPAEPEARAWPRPRIFLFGGRFIDEGGLVEAQGITGVIEPDGAVALTLEILKPSPAPCRLSGRPERVELDCASPLSISLRPGVSLEVPQVTLQRRPEAWAELRGARLRLGGLPEVIEPMLDGLGFEARLGFEKGVDGSRPLNAALTFPAGGRIEAQGTVGARQATLRTEVTELDLAPISTVLQGQVSANVGLTVDLAERRAELEGDVRFANLLIDHRAVADDKVGPYSLGLKGKIRLEQLKTQAPSLDPAPPSALAAPPAPRFRLSVEEGIASLGDVRVRVDGELEGDTMVRRATARVDAGRMDAPALVGAFPPGFLPHLQPLSATGHAALAFTVNLDFDHPDKTDLQVSADFKQLEVTRLNPAIDVESLRKSFETHFEMPDGEVLVNLTGPESERWTPLTAVAPLLPIAIVTQEDGGFYNHKGISLLHLRGSLVANVEKGRFARGGSTLTMQLARNVFLNRRKTLSRKLEEVIVAWLLEQNFNKDELMELYLNVVEFGPKIFGIRDAAVYYFAKQPAELTPTEVAFIARLLPNPRKFHVQFEKGEIQPYFASSMLRLLSLLVERGHLSRAELDAARPKALFVRPP